MHFKKLAKSTLPLLACNYKATNYTKYVTELVKNR